MTRHRNDDPGTSRAVPANLIQVLSFQTEFRKKPKANFACRCLPVRLEVKRIRDSLLGFLLKTFYLKLFSLQKSKTICWRRDPRWLDCWMKRGWPSGEKVRRSIAPATTNGYNQLPRPIRKSCILVEFKSIFYDSCCAEVQVESGRECWSRASHAQRSYRPVWSWLHWFLDKTAPR